MPISSPIIDVDIPPVDVTSFFFSKAQARLDSLVAAGEIEPSIVVDTISGHSLRFSDIQKQANAIAYSVAARLPTATSRRSTQNKLDSTVIVFSPNSILCVSIHFGALMAGCTYAMMEPELDASLLATRLKETEPIVAAFVDPQLLPVFIEALNKADIEFPAESLLLLGGDNSSYSSFDSLLLDATDKQFSPCSFSESELAEKVALIIYSSGVTGPPKGIMLTHRNIVAMMVMVGGYSARSSVVSNKTSSPATSRRSQSHILSALPLWHIYGHCVLCYQPFINGDCAVQLPSFEATAYLGAIEKYGVNRISGTPRLLHALLRETTKVGENTAIVDAHPSRKFDIGTVKVVGCGGSSLPPALKQKCSDYFGGAPVVVGYGMTESTSIIAGNSWCTPAPGAVGVLYPNTIAKVVDAQGNETSGIGELCISGPHIMKGYIGSESVFKSIDGFFHTGDYVQLSKNGHVYLHGRLTDIIHTSQGPVSPTDVESILATCPAIEDSAVVGVGTQGSAQAVACVILARSQTPKENLLADITQWIRKQAGNEEIACCETTAIPKTISGKILRRCLVEQIIMHR